jgi:hypothetical protein
MFNILKFHNGLYNKSKQLRNSARLILNTRNSDRPLNNIVLSLIILTSLIQIISVSQSTASMVSIHQTITKTTKKVCNNSCMLRSKVEPKSFHSYLITSTQTSPIEFPSQLTCYYYTSSIIQSCE